MGDVPLGKYALQLTRSFLVSGFYASLLKAAVGRAHPPDMGALLPAVAVACTPVPGALVLLLLSSCKNSDQVFVFQWFCSTAESLTAPCFRSALDEDTLCRHPRDTSNASLADSSTVWFWAGQGKVYVSHDGPGRMYMDSPTTGRFDLWEGWPSGHMLIAAAVSTTLIGGWFRDQSCLSAGCVVMMTLTAATMACSVHWLSDVVAAVCLGVPVGIAALRVPMEEQKWCRCGSKEPPVPPQEPPPEKRHVYKIGDAVQVFSRTSKGWCSGEVIDVIHLGHRQDLVVTYKLSDGHGPIDSETGTALDQGTRTVHADDYTMVLPGSFEDSVASASPASSP
eukprot:SAG31_NODE_1928_length_6883_cov_6.045106_4_plen_337_part_00